MEWTKRPISAKSEPRTCHSGGDWQRLAPWREAAIWREGFGFGFVKKKNEEIWGFAWADWRFVGAGVQGLVGVHGKGSISRFVVVFEIGIWSAGFDLIGWDVRKNRGCESGLGVSLSLGVWLLASSLALTLKPVLTLLLTIHLNSQLSRNPI